jgi:hypothetical protein
LVSADNGDTLERRCLHWERCRVPCPLVWLWCSCLGELGKL